MVHPRVCALTFVFHWRPLICRRWISFHDHQFSVLNLTQGLNIGSRYVCHIHISTGFTMIIFVAQSHGEFSQKELE